MLLVTGCGGSGDTTSDTGTDGVAGAPAQGAGGTGGASGTRGADGTAGHPAADGTGGKGAGGRDGNGGMGGGAATGGAMSGGAGGVAGQGGGNNPNAAPPRPIAPLSTSTVTSQTPTLRWQLAADTTGAHVDVCRDRACTQIEQALDATGTTARPTTALAAGVHYWRLRASDGTTFGPVWQFTVGHHGTAVDTSWGTTPDFNGDGFADVALGAPGLNPGDGDVNSGAGAVYVRSGAVGGLGATSMTLQNPDVTSGPVGGAFGHDLASAGDVNGDGYADLVVSAPYSVSTGGSVFVYLGSATGLALTPSTTLTFAGSDGTDQPVMSVGDVNGDGYGDILVQHGAASWIMSVYLGSAAGVSATAATTLTVPNLSNIAAASAGDLNGDGYADIVVVSMSASDATKNGIYVWLGAVTGLSAAPTVALASPLKGQLLPVVNAGDVNGDGYADVLLGTASSGMIASDSALYVYSGSAGGIESTPATISTKEAGNQIRAITSAGDVNGDGYVDVAVAAFDTPSHNGTAADCRVYIYPGSPAGLGASPVETLTSSKVDATLIGIADAGDVNGDGYTDFVLGAAYQKDVPSPVVSASVYFGGTAGLSGAVGATFSGPSNLFYGASVASADDVFGGRRAHVFGGAFDILAHGAFRRAGADTPFGTAVRGTWALGLRGVIDVSPDAAKG